MVLEKGEGPYVWDVEGKKYYLELKAINAKKAEKYVDFFKEEENKWKNY